MRWLFSFNGKIGRRTYALWSLGVFLSPQLVAFALHLLSPHRPPVGLGIAYLLLVALALAALAFRRAKDANLSGWIAVLAALPVVQLPVISYLCLVPSEARETRSRLIATVGLLAGAALTVLAVGVGALVFGVHREVIPLHVRLILGVLVLLTLPPFVIGATTGYIENRHGDLGAARTARSALTATALGYLMFTALLIGAAIPTGLGLLLPSLFDAIGDLRIIVAPLFVLGIALIGGALGRAIAMRSRLPTRHLFSASESRRWCSQPKMSCP